MVVRFYFFRILCEFLRYFEKNENLGITFFLDYKKYRKQGTYGNFFYYIDNDFRGFVVRGGYSCYVFLDFVFVYVNRYRCVIGVVDVWFVCGV